MHSVHSVVELLEFNAYTSPNGIAYTFIVDEKKAESITYLELSNKVKLIAAHLQEKVQPGERAILLYPPGIDFISGFLGCLYAQVIAIPVYPPTNINLIEKLKKILKNSEPKIIIGNSKTKRSLDILNKLKFSTSPSDGSPTDNIPFLITDTLSAVPENRWKKACPDKDSVAFLQYTSGSTGDPKGVIVTHGNIVNNLHKIYVGMGCNPHDRAVSWLPPYHDMGLIGGILEPLYCSIPCILFSPVQFLINPHLWLKTIMDYSGTVSGAPNFAYDYCTKKITAEQKSKLDLSKWRLAFNGSEPINHRTLNDFYNAFKECGFRESAFFPCYGLAEATLYVSGADPHLKYHWVEISKNAIKNNHVEFSTIRNNQKYLISCGVVGSELKIINPETLKACSPQEIGEIWIANESVTKGYWNQPAISSEIFGATIQNEESGQRYLRTGDLGFVYNQELYVTGRIKELIIIHGHNYYPQDIESSVVYAHHEMKLGNCVAFNINGRENEELVIICQIDTAVKTDLKQITNKICNAVMKEHQLPIYDVVFLPPKALAKTTSGKLRRSLIKQQYIEHSLEMIFSSRSHNQAHQSVFIAPQTNLEIQVCTIISKLLDGRQISLSDTFLNLGFDSLLAVQLSSRILSDFDVEIDVSTFFDNKKVEDIVLLIEKLKKQIFKKKRTVNLTKRKIRANKIPLSSAQQRIWFLNQYSLGSALANISIKLAIEGSLDTQYLERSLSLLISRHEILRAQFYDVGGMPYQMILPERNIKLPVSELGHLSPEELHVELNNITKFRAEKIFDLSMEPLFDFILLKIKEDEHVIIFTFHHIIVDGWSLNLLFKELSIIYNAFVYNEKPLLSNHDLQYSDFVSWEKKQQTLNHHVLLYWREKLKNLDFMLHLKTDKPRKNNPSFQKESVEFKIPSNTLKEINRLAHKNNCTLFMVLLAMYHLFLYRYTGEENNVIGSPVTNRGNAQLQNIIGFIANTLPFYTKCSPNESFIQLLANVRKTTLDALNHQEIQLEQLIHDLNLKRHSQINPLFQTLFVLQDFDKNQLNFAKTKTTIDVNAVVFHFDIILEITKLDNLLQGRIIFDNDLFYESTAKQMSFYFNNLVNEVLREPNTPLALIKFLPPSESEQIIYKWNDTSYELRGNRMLHHLIEEQAQINPKQMALSDEKQSLSYDELNILSNQLANKLVSIGAVSGDFIPVILDRTVELIICFLATLKIGAICVPVEPNYPEERLRFILNTIDSKRIILDSNFAYIKSFDLNKMLFIDQEWDNIRALNPYFKSVQLPPETTIAFVIYTSGSTGTPKGVLIPHRGLVERILWLNHTLPLNTKDKLIHQFSFSFDAAITSLWWPLSSGATTFIPASNHLSDIDFLINIINEQRITALSTIPSVLFHLLNGLKIHRHSITKIICGGEPFTNGLLNQAKEIKNCQIYNLYGPTECSVFSTACALHEYTGECTPPVGKPIWNTQMYILNDYLNPVPLNVAGELYIGGHGVTYGYLNQPDLTQERFIKNPFSNDGSSLYKTGDFAKFLSDGSIVYLGRMDRQLKINGHRIEPEEIEIALLSIPAINKTAAIAYHQEGVSNSNSLIAFIETDDPDSLPPHSINQLLSNSLPLYMIPNEFVFLKRFPYLPNGKIDFFALTNLLKNRVIDQSTRSNTSTEKQLIAIWQEIFKYPQLGIKDNFFFLGGNSITALQLINLIKRKLKKEIPLELFFKYQTIETQARYIETINAHFNKPRESDSTLIKLNNSSSNKILFCIHPIGGNVFQYVALANLLKNDFIVYGIKSIGLDGTTPPLKDINEMAHFYISEMRTVQPSGPYFIIGWSSGGLIAVEIAKIMAKSNDDIALLSLIDTYDPIKIKPIKEMSYKTLFNHIRAMTEDNLTHVGLESYSLKVKLSFKLYKMISPLNGIFRVLFSNVRKVFDAIDTIRNDLCSPESLNPPIKDWIQNLKGWQLISPHIDEELLCNYYQVFRANYYALKNYSLNINNGPILYFEAENHPKQDQWHLHASNIQKYTIPSNHYNALSHPESLKIICNALCNETQIKGDAS